MGYASDAIVANPRPADVSVVATSGKTVRLPRPPLRAVDLLGARAHVWMLDIEPLAVRGGCSCVDPEFRLLVRRSPDRGRYAHEPIEDPARSGQQHHADDHVG